MKKIRNFLDGVKRRFRLWRICRALEITPHNWQARYALRKTEELPWERRSGKTLAVILRALVDRPVSEVQLIDILKADPDFGMNLRAKVFTFDEYLRKFDMCVAAGVPVGPRFTRRGFQRELTCERNTEHNTGFNILFN